MSSLSKSPETNLMGQGPGKYVFPPRFSQSGGRIINCLPLFHPVITEIKGTIFAWLISRLDDVLKSSKYGTIWVGPNSISHLAAQPIPTNPLIHTLAGFSYQHYWCVDPEIQKHSPRNPKIVEKIEEKIPFLFSEFCFRIFWGKICSEIFLRIYFRKLILNFFANIFIGFFLKFVSIFWGNVFNNFS